MGSVSEACGPIDIITLERMFSLQVPGDVAQLELAPSASRPDYTLDVAGAGA
jgi:hypothetical protein